MSDTGTVLKEHAMPHMTDKIRREGGGDALASQRPGEGPGAMSYSAVNVGDRIFFGKYPKELVADPEPIEWIVLDKRDGALLLISRYGLDCREYKDHTSGCTWDTCSLRTWLNGRFLKYAFSSAEKAKIQSTRVTADRNPVYETPVGNDTTDKVFLLSIEEVNRYFDSDSARQCEPTMLAKEVGAWTGRNGNCQWWLRSPGCEQGYAAFIYYGGSVWSSGNFVDEWNHAVRPAIWINPDADEGDLDDVEQVDVDDRESIFFGNYPQQKNGDREPIEWIVLEKRDDSVLLISRYGLDRQSFHTSCSAVTWETCSLRAWLNETFLAAAFSPDEQAVILNTTVTADRSPIHRTSAGNDTTDKVFLLSVEEANRYFDSDDARQCRATAYAKAQGAYADYLSGVCGWWLRTPGFVAYAVAKVFPNGSVSVHGGDVDSNWPAVRPVLRIRSGSLPV